MTDRHWMILGVIVAVAHLYLTYRIAREAQASVGRLQKKIEGNKILRILA